MSKGDHDIQKRLEYQIHLLLAEMEEQPEMFDFKIRLTVVEKVGMYLTRQQKLGDDVGSLAGSTVRKYAGAFQTNVARGGGSKARSAKPALAYDNTTDSDDAAD